MRPPQAKNGLNMRIPSGRTLSQSRERRWLGGVLLATTISRAVYFLYFGIRFDDQPLAFYMQYIDPDLLRSALAESLFYLREQPPLFNLFLGAILKLFPAREHFAFHASFFLCGLAVTTATYLLMTRLRMPPPYCALFAALFAVAPATVLFENWLFYTYPVTVLLCLAALFLHRFLRDGKTSDGMVFALLSSALALTYGVFHLAWQIAVLGLLFVSGRTNRKQVLAVSLSALALTGSLYLKNYALFGRATGGLHVGWNLAIVGGSYLDPAEIEELKRDEALSPMTWTLLSGKSTLRDYKPYIPESRPTGVAVLDSELKSTGWENFNHHSWSYIGDVFRRDGIYLVTRYPKAYLSYLRMNMKRYFQAASDHHFDRGGIDQYPNGKRLLGMLKAYHAYSGGANWVILPVCVLFSAAFGVRCLTQRSIDQAAASEKRADGLTILFCLFNILYLGSLTVGLSFGDQNRYRFSVMPFYYVFFAMILWRVSRRVVRNRLERYWMLRDSPTRQNRLPSPDNP